MWCREIAPPIAPDDVAAALADIAIGAPLGRVEIAGPQTEDLVDLTRRTFAARGERVHLVPTWSGTFGPGMAGDVLLPGPDAHLARTTFDDWLAAGGVLAAQR